MDSSDDEDLYYVDESAMMFYDMDGKLRSNRNTVDLSHNGAELAGIRPGGVFKLSKSPVIVAFADNGKGFYVQNKLTESYKDMIHGHMTLIYDNGYLSCHRTAYQPDGKTEREYIDLVQVLKFVKFRSRKTDLPGPFPNFLPNKIERNPEKLDYMFIRSIKNYENIINDTYKYYSEKNSRCKNLVPEIFTVAELIGVLIENEADKPLTHEICLRSLHDPSDSRGSPDSSGTRICAGPSTSGGGQSVARAATFVLGLAVVFGSAIVGSIGF